MSDDARHLGVARHLELALRLAGSAEGLTEAEMGVVVRTVQRMRAALETVFPMEVVPDGARRRYRIVGGPSPDMAAPLAEELAELALARSARDAAGEAVRSGRLAALELRILAAIRAAARARIERDPVDALRPPPCPAQPDRPWRPDLGFQRRPRPPARRGRDPGLPGADHGGHHMTHAREDCGRPFYPVVRG